MKWLTRIVYVLAVFIFFFISIMGIFDFLKNNNYFALLVAIFGFSVSISFLYDIIRDKDSGFEVCDTW